MRAVCPTLTAHDHATTLPTRHPAGIRGSWKGPLPYAYSLLAAKLCHKVPACLTSAHHWLPDPMRTRRDKRRPPAFTRRRKPRKPAGDNPFALVGSPIPGLIGAEELDRVLDEDALAALVDAAKVPPSDLVFRHKAAPVPRRVWFARMVRATVRDWLGSAHRPAVREVANELGEFARRLHDALTECTARVPGPCRGRL